MPSKSVISKPKAPADYLPNHAMHGISPARTLIGLPALRRGAATFPPRYGEGPFNPASL